MKLANISIIGSGYVGTNTGKRLKDLGNSVIFYDIDENKINQLKQEGYSATNDLDYAVRNSDISFVSVPTPTNEEINLEYLKSAVTSLAKSLKNKTQYHVVVIKSTVVPTTTELVVKPIIEKVSGKKCGTELGLCMNPEFIVEFNTTTADPELKAWYEENIPRSPQEDKIVIGEFDKKSGDTLENIFKPLKVPIFRTNPKTAEMIKYASNCCLSSKLSYWNEIYMICEKYGIDGKFVAKVASNDKRIGKYGIVSGHAFGGKCLPKDLQAFISHVEKTTRYTPKLLKAVRSVNEDIAKEKGTVK